MDKLTLFAKRKEFFDEIIDALLKEPSEIDEVLNQTKYYIKPDRNKIITNPELGDVAILINGEFFNKNFTIHYTLWQLGNILKVGVAIHDDDLHGAFASDSHNEVFYIWGEEYEPKVDVARGCVFYDWSFNATNIYDSYREQEKFILGIRHMHFRAMRIIHDECQRIESSKKNDSFSNVNLSSFVDDLKLGEK
jgi:hypothetical protein